MDFQFDDDASQYLPADADGTAPQWKAICCRYRATVCSADGCTTPSPPTVCKDGGDGEHRSSCPSSLWTGTIWRGDHEPHVEARWRWTNGEMSSTNALDCSVVIQAPAGFVVALEFTQVRCHHFKTAVRHLLNSAVRHFRLPFARREK